MSFSSVNYLIFINLFSLIHEKKTKTLIGLNCQWDPDLNNNPGHTREKCKTGCLKTNSSVVCSKKLPFLGHYDQLAQRPTSRSPVEPVPTPVEQTSQKDLNKKYSYRCLSVRNHWAKWADLGQRLRTDLRMRRWYVWAVARPGNFDQKFKPKNYN